MWYLSIASLVFVYWFSFFLADRETKKDHLMSWVVLIIASLLWPITVPGAMIELASKVKSNNQKVKSDNQQNESSQVC